MTFKLKLIRKEEICRDTYGLYFNIRNSGLSYAAGQYVTVTVPDLIANDGKGSKRHFSIANAPNSSDFIEIIIRRSDSDFSNSILSLPAESELLFGEPQGEIRSSRIQDNTVFVTGGTGITPVRSILKDLEQKHIDRKITLFYANRSPDYAAFLEELTQLEKEKHSFTFIPVFEELKENESAAAEKGFFSEEIFKKYINPLDKHVYYVTGPPLMIHEAIRVLKNCGVPHGKIFIENI